MIHKPSRVACSPLGWGPGDLKAISGFAALRNRDFAFYLSASFLATTALAMQSVALGWQIYYLTGKPFDLGLVGLMEFLPAFCLALVSGQIADRFDRRSVLFLGLLIFSLSFSLSFSFRSFSLPSFAIYRFSIALNAHLSVPCVPSCCTLPCSVSSVFALPTFFSWISLWF